MQVKQRHNNVRQGGVSGERSNFRIAMNAKMFKTLSDSLYQDKPGSIVREIVCNAVDAHRMAGKADVPVTVHLPNALEPWFSVRDEGVGLSDDDIRTVYSSYGESTKDQSNDQIGAFGLGSKTPFAYTDQFTVTSIHGGMKRIYVAVIGDDGMPHISLQSETVCGEHPGLEVTLAIKNEDARYFHYAVRHQLMFLPVRPVLTNNLDDVSIKDISSGIKLVKDGLTVYEGGYGCAISNLWVTQGGVGYPLNITNLGDMPKDTKEFLESLDAHGAVIDFPIGQIEVTASREGISYDDDTIKNIITRMQEAARALCDDAMTTIRATSNQWDRAVLFNQQLPVVQSAIANAPDFDNVFTAFNIATPHYGRRHANVNMVFRAERLEKIGAVGVLMEKHTFNRRGTYDKGVRIRRVSVVSPGSAHFYEGHTGSLLPVKDTHVFIRDTNKKPVARINAFCEANDYPYTLMIEPSTYDGDIDAAFVKRVAKALCIDDSKIRMLSSLAAPVSASRSNNDKRPRAYRFDGGNNLHNTGRSTEWYAEYDSIDDLDAGVYIKMERHHLELDADVRILMDGAKTGLFTMPIYAVNGQTAARIAGGKVGAQLYTAKEAVDRVRPAIDAAKRDFAAYVRYDGFVDNCSDRLIGSLLNRGTICSWVGKVQSIRKRMDQLEERVTKYKFALSRDAVLDKYREGGKLGEVRSAEFYARYPMLRHVNAYSSANDMLDDAISYMKMIDKGA
jgi:hypothetical protein